MESSPTLSTKQAGGDWWERRGEEVDTAGWGLAYLNESVWEYKDLAGESSSFPLPLFLPPTSL